MSERRARPRSAAAGEVSSGGTPVRRLCIATATAFQPHAPFVPHSIKTVSYTHLTLPTICSV
eukprot:8591163-Alexandrium_andersonii.AAC.1